MEPYPSAIEDVPAKIIYMGKDVRKYGMMKKKSGGRKIPVFQGLYDSRLVIINKGWVYYYKDKTSEKPQGKFSLQGFSSTVINAEEEEATMPFVFKVYSKKANERTWYFATDTKLDMEQWMEAFRLEIEQYNMKGIPNIRPSKSCPVNPHSGLSRPDINNGRPQSVHTTATPMPNHLSVSQFSSRTDVTSGIGSSTHSIDTPDDLYEPVEDLNLDGGEPGYPSNYPPTVTSPHRQFSPFDRRALPPVLEPRGQVGGPQDLPPRPPPAPPAESVGKNYHRENPSLTNQFHSSPGVNKPYEVGAQSLPSSTGAEKQKGFIPPPRKQFSPRPPHMSSAIPPPMLPPKPSTPKDPSKNSQVGFSMPAFKPELHDEQYYSDNYNDTGQAEYDDNVEGNSEDQSYEEPYSESETIDEIIYEDEPQVHKSPPPTPPVKPGKKPATSPPPVAMKPATKFASATDSKADHKPVGSSTSWQPVLKSPNAGPTSVGKLRSHTSSSPNVPFGKPSSTSSRPQEEDDNRPSWMRTKLKTVDESKVTSKPARAVSEADTGHKPPWVKDKPSVTAQKPAPLSKLPWQRDAPQPNNKFVKHVIPSKDASANFSNLNPTTRPHVALKPTGLKQKPAVGSKPAPPQKPNTQTQVAGAQHIKPTAPLQTHKPAVPGAKPSTHLTKLRDRFNQ